MIRYVDQNNQFTLECMSVRADAILRTALALSADERAWLATG
jgi:hypothetical protein